MIVTLSSSEQSSFISYFFHQRSTGDQHVYVQKHPNSAHASSADFFGSLRERGEVYCARGRMENLIKDMKLYTRSDRTSCHRWEANQFRLFLHMGAYTNPHIE